MKSIQVSLFETWWKCMYVINDEKPQTFSFSSNLTSKWDISIICFKWQKYLMLKTDVELSEMSLETKSLKRRNAFMGLVRLTEGIQWLWNVKYDIDIFSWVFHDRPIWHISVRLSDRSKSYTEQNKFRQKLSLLGFELTTSRSSVHALLTVLSQYMVVGVNH